MTARFVRIGAVAAAVAIAASCSAAQPPHHSIQALGDSGATAMSPGTTVPVSLAARLELAQTAAQDRGAAASIAIFDRTAHRYIEAGGDNPVETASVAKLFIAEDLYQQDASGERPLTEDDYGLLIAMLESSDDTAANLLWDAAGGSDLVTRVAERYSLVSTAPSLDGLWWNTETTAHDLIIFYDGILDDVAQLGADRVEQFVDYLRQSTPTAADGYDQRFGLPDALFDEPVIGVKQGWMCCIAGQWIHLTTGIIGADNRYVVAMTVREDVQYQDEENYGLVPDTSFTDPVNDESSLHARDTVTGVTQILFPTGVVEEWSPITLPGEEPAQEASGR